VNQQPLPFPVEARYRRSAVYDPRQPPVVRVLTPYR